MPEKNKQIGINHESLQVLKQFTNARLALGRTGTSMPVKANLDLQLAHALARDAVSLPLDFSALAQQLAGYHLTIQLQSQVNNHPEYLQRPDKGRFLNTDSIARLKDLHSKDTKPDLVIIIADGLSSKAIENHAITLLSMLLPALQCSTYSIAPICLVKYARVAIGDPIGELVNARMSIVFIGERPGLSSPDSLGIYFTYQPGSGKTDAQRNCISNIHRQGLDYQAAIKKLMFLIQEADRIKLSGVELKDSTEDNPLSAFSSGHSNFLLE